MLDSKSLAGRELRASILGRWNGIFYFVPLGAVVTRDVLGFTWPSDGLIGLLGLALVVSTGISMLDRAWAFFRPSEPS